MLTAVGTPAGEATPPSVAVPKAIQVDRQVDMHTLVRRSMTHRLTLMHTIDKAHVSALEPAYKAANHAYKCLCKAEDLFSTLSSTYTERCLGNMAICYDVRRSALSLRWRRCSWRRTSRPR